MARLLIHIINMLCIGIDRPRLSEELFHSIHFSLNTEKRQRQQAQHESEFQRLQRQISQVRPSYSVRELQQDYAKSQDVKKRMSKFPSNDK